MNQRQNIDLFENDLLCCDSPYLTFVGSFARIFVLAEFNTQVIILHF